MKDHWPYYMLVAFCVLVSLGWFAGAIAFAAPLDAGRGGALGVAASFFALFLQNRGRYISIDVIDDATKAIVDTLKREISSAELAHQNSVRIDAIKRDMDRARRKTKVQNLCISAASAFSSVVWGFGDYFANLLVGM